MEEKNRHEEKLYHYKALVTEVYDGDTLTADIELGFYVDKRKQKLRLRGIDTPELRGEEREQGLIVRDIVRSMILNKEVIIETYKDETGKYGRLLATVYINGLNLNQWLIDNGHAIAYL